MTERRLAIRPDGVLTNRTSLDDPRVSRLLALLARDGEDARLVGGAVRNALLGLVAGDIDIATTALPEQVLDRLRAAKIRAIPTGVPHGTVTAIVDRLPLEITTLREDVETDGRHAVVRFGRDFTADAQRRDFTINALSADRVGRVFDATGGLEDLRAGRVRFIGDPHIRIREDYLRILRFFRFSATYATGALDPQGLAASVAAADGLDRLSRERIRMEIFKLLVAPRAAETIKQLGASGLLDRVVGRPCRPQHFARCRAIEMARGADPDAVLGLAALSLQTEADALALRYALRLSNGERDRLVRLAACLHAGAPAGVPDARAISTLLFSHGREAALDAITLWQVGDAVPAEDRAWQAAWRFAAIADVPALPVSGADIVARGVARGPRVGETLKILQAKWIRAGFPHDPAALHQLLDEAVVMARANAAS